MELPDSLNFAEPQDPKPVPVPPAPAPLVVQPMQGQPAVEPQQLTQQDELELERLVSTAQLMAQRQEARRREELSYGLKLAAEQDPDMAAQQQKFAQQLNVKPEEVANNWELTQQFIKQQQLQNAVTDTRYPILAEQLRTPNFAAVSHDDIQALQRVEGLWQNIKNSWELGGLTVERGQIGAAMAGGWADADDLARLQEIDRQMREIPKPQGLVTSVLSGTTEVVSQMLETVPYSLGTAYAAGKTATMIGGPKAGAAAFAWGFGSAQFLQSGQIEGGNAYADYIEQGYSQESAAAAAFGVGIVNGALETLGLKLATAPTRQFARGLFKKQATEAFVDRTSQSAFWNAVKGYGKAVGGEVGTEVAQDLTTITAGEIAKRYSRPELDSKFGSMQGIEEVGTQIMEIASKTLESMILLGAPGSVGIYMTDAKRIDQAKATYDALNATVKGVQDTKVLERAPEALRSLLEQAVDPTMPEVYISAKDLVEIIKAHDAQLTAAGGAFYKSAAEQMQERFPEQMAQLEKAVAEGGTLTFKTSEFTTKLKGFDMQQALLENVRSDPNGLSNREAQAYRKEIDKMAPTMQSQISEKAKADKEFRDSVRKVRNEIIGQLRATGGFTDQQARFVAEIQTAMVMVQAAGEKVSPEQWWQQRGSRVQTERQPRLAPVPIPTRLQQPIVQPPVAPAPAPAAPAAAAAPEAAPAPEMAPAAPEAAPAPAEAVSPEVASTQPVPLTRTEQVVAALTEPGSTLTQEQQQELVLELLNDPAAALTEDERAPLQQWLEQAQQVTQQQLPVEPDPTLPTPQEVGQMVEEIVQLEQQIQQAEAQPEAAVEPVVEAQPVAEVAPAVEPVAAPQPQASAPTSFSLFKDGIEGVEVSYQQVPFGNAAFEYAVGKVEQDGAVGIFRRNASERGTYGGWRWEANADRLSPSVEPAPVQPPAAVKPAVAKKKKQQLEKKLQDVVGPDGLTELQRAARALLAGEMTRDQWEQLIAQQRPIRRMQRVPELSTMDSIHGAVKSNQKPLVLPPEQVGVDGQKIMLRTDIPAKTNYGVDVVSVHQWKSQRAAGKVIGFTNAMVIDNVEFGVDETKAEYVATKTGKRKGRKDWLGTANGNKVQMSAQEAKALAEQAFNDPSWVQVGMNPALHSYFYDRATGQPIVSADRVIQIGTLLLAKNPVTAPREQFLFSRMPTTAAITESNVEQIVADNLEGVPRKGEWRDVSTAIDPKTHGHCYVAAEAAYFLLGGKEAGWQPKYLNNASWPDGLDAGQTHHFLQHKETGRVIDPTRAQFGNVIIPYDQGKSQAWVTNKKKATESPSKRAQIVIDNVAKSFGSALRSRMPTTAAKLDADYLAAVERGDMETAQRMVEAAAKQAGYYLGPVFHGTTKQFDVFSVSANTDRPTKAIWLSPDRSFAQAYPLKGNSLLSANDVRTVEVYANWQKVFNPQDPGAPNEFMRELRKAHYIRDNNQFSEQQMADIQRGWWMMWERPAVLDAVLERYDAIVMQEDGVTTIATKDPRSVKSADPVTRDASGNVIPLSQRFDLTKDSILFSRMFNGVQAQPLTENNADTVPKVFDAENGIGQVPANENIDYLGFKVIMTPAQFRRLVPPGVAGEQTKAYVADALRADKKIGQPFLEVEWNNGSWQVVNHEGRSRSDAFADVFGSNANMEVHILPVGMRSRDLTQQQKTAMLLPQRLRSQQPEGEVGGTYSHTDRAITLMNAVLNNKEATVATYMHEMMHWMFATLMDAVAQGRATPEMRADLETLVKWGSKGKLTLDQFMALPFEEQRQVSEAVAYGFELSLMEGIDPGIEFRGIMHKIREWFVAAWKAITTINERYYQETGEDLPGMTPEVKQVYTRMIGAENQVALAKISRSAIAIFQTKDEFVKAGNTEEEWDRYQSIQAERDQEWIDQLMREAVQQVRNNLASTDQGLKRYGKEVQAVRKEIENEVRPQAERLAINRARRYLLTGEMMNEQGVVTQGAGAGGIFKMNRQEVLGDFDTENMVLGELDAKLNEAKREMAVAEGIVVPDLPAEFTEEAPPAAPENATKTQKKAAKQARKEYNQRKDEAAAIMREAKDARRKAQDKRDAAIAEAMPKVQAAERELRAAEAKFQREANVEAKDHPLGKYTAKDGVPVGVVAQLFGYTSAQQFLDDLQNKPTVEQTTKDLADKRMNEEYGDFITPDAQEEAVIRSQMNRFQQQWSSRELRYLLRQARVTNNSRQGLEQQKDAKEALVDIENEIQAKRSERKVAKENGADALVARLDQEIKDLVEDRRELEIEADGSLSQRLIIAAAREAARIGLNDMQVRSLRPGIFAAAARRNSQEAFHSLTQADYQAAIDAKRKQVGNEAKAQLAARVRLELSSAKRFFKKVMRGNNTQIGKTRDLNVVYAARAILLAFGFGGSEKQRAAKQEDLDEAMRQLKEYLPDVHEKISRLIESGRMGAKPFSELTYGEFTRLNEAVRDLWDTAKNMRSVELDNRKYEIADVRKQVADRTAVLTKGRGERPGVSRAKTRMQKLYDGFFSTAANARRAESLFDQWDGREPGVFTKLFWRPIQNAVTAYRKARIQYYEKYAKLVAAMTWETKEIDAQQYIGYTFKNKAELVAALLHMGNASNMRKLLLGGRGPEKQWAKLNDDGSLDRSGWDRMVQDLTSNGDITQQDMDFVQNVWDLLETIKPDMQRTYKRLHNEFFEEVKAEAFTVTFADGSTKTYRGGYVPAKVDRDLAIDYASPASVEDMKADFRNSIPAVEKGSTITRVENFTKPLSLDLSRIGQHIDETTRFIYVQPAIHNILQLLNDKGAKTEDGQQQAGILTLINTLDPTAREMVIIPWLNRVASQRPGMPGMSSSMDRIMNAGRNRAGMAIMFLNLSNAMQQFTGIIPAALKVPPSYLLGALRRYMSSQGRADMQAAIAAKSDYTRNRMDKQIFEVISDTNDILVNPSKYEKAQRWAQKNAYILQQKTQNIVDTVVWNGAYNHALATLPKTMTEAEMDAEAVARADAAVRLTQGSTQPESVSKVEAGTPFLRAFTQFTSYFNTIANLNVTEFRKIIDEVGFRGGAGKLFSTWMIGFAAPMLAASAIARGFAGKWDDEDDDGYADEIGNWLIDGVVKGSFQMVPFGNAVYSAVVGPWTDTVYDDRMMSNPAINIIERMAGAVKASAVAAVSEERDLRGSNVKDLMLGFDIITGIPVTPLFRPISYGYGVMQDQIDPYNVADLARGLVTGIPAEGTRNR